MKRVFDVITVDRLLLIICVTITLCLLFVLNAHGSPPSEGTLSFAREALAGLFGITGYSSGRKVVDVMKKTDKNKDESSSK